LLKQCCQNMRMSLRAEHLCFAYTAEQPILNNLSFELQAGELHFIVGANGSGKSTLLQCLAQLLPIAANAVISDSRVAYLPQTIAPCQDFSVQQVVELGAQLSENCDIKELMRQLKIDHLAKRTLSQLSGGERQRVLVAAVLAEQPKFLLLDEPSSSLDIHHQVELFRLLKTFCAKGVGIAVVCHDWNISSRYADRISLVHNSTIMKCGKPQEVITSENLQQLFGSSVVVTHLQQTPVVMPAHE
jgi:iron complex transport system ATP-binding protein